MKGSYHIRVENKRLRYDLDIRRNITIIRGDSATGKTTLIEMLQSAEQDGTASGVSLSCDKPCVVLDRIRWEENLEMIHNSIVFLDEQNHFMESEEFAVKIRQSDNYYVLITRVYLSNLPYSVDEIYGIRESGKYLHLNKSYHHITNFIGFMRTGSCRVSLTV
jgi:predicted AAA+ superfamily ATPase